MPGERLRFDGGTIYINEQVVTPPPVLAGRRTYLLPIRESRYRDGETIVLKNDEYFFIGDNVDRSMDSRIAGPSRASALVGVVDLIYWPPGRMRVVR